MSLGTCRAVKKTAVLMFLVFELSGCLLLCLFRSSFSPACQDYFLVIIMKLRQAGQEKGKDSPVYTEKTGGTDVKGMKEQSAGL